MASVDKVNAPKNGADDDRRGERDRKRAKHMSQEGVEREWEVLGDAKDEASSKKSSANILGGATASELVESFWRKARGKDEGGNTGLSCEDVIERSEAALSSTILGGREDGVEAAEAGEGGESECGGGHADEYRLFEPLRTRVESTLTAMFYDFGLEDSKTFSALSSSSTKLANT